MIETEKTTVEPKLYNSTSNSTTIWNTQSTTGKTTSIWKIKQNITQNPISTTTSSKEIRTGNIDCTFGLYTDRTVNDVVFLRMQPETFCLASPE